MHAGAETGSNLLDTNVVLDATSAGSGGLKNDDRTGSATLKYVPKYALLLHTQKLEKK